MRALMRDKNELVRDCDGIEGIDWKTGAPLTNPDWAGGPYTLVNDCAPDDPDADDGATYTCTNPSAASQPADPTPAAAPADTIVIDGVTYTRTS